jgi:Fusaric acid resistance protein-like
LNRFVRPSAAVAAESKGFLGEMVRLEKSSLSLRTGARAGLVAIAPLVLGLAIGQPQWVYATLGAMFLFNTEGPPATALPLRVALLACLTEPFAFGIGTLAGLTGFWAVLVVGLGVFVARLSSGNPTLAQVGTFTAIFFAVGVGLPGGSVAAAWERLWIGLVGAFWGLLGAWFHRAITSKWHFKGALEALSGPLGSRARAYFRVPSRRSDEFRLAAAVGAASAVGLAIGLLLGFPRDFWIVVTILLATRPKIGPTLFASAMMVVGTILGAVIAAGITLEIHEVPVLEILLLAFGIGMFASRGVNLALVQVFFTPFLIILLNLLYPGEWYLAEVRIVDVAIGGALAIATVYVLWIRKLIRDFRDRVGSDHRHPTPRL